DNADHYLKPGMFVKIELSTSQQPSPILVPSSAVQEHEGKHFVFVQQGVNKFLRRDVQVGPTNDKSVVIRQGLTEGKSIGMGGGFILKSQLLAEVRGEQ